jgi:hypothetical protein
VGKRTPIRAEDAANRQLLWHVSDLREFVRFASELTAKLAELAKQAKCLGVYS